EGVGPRSLVAVLILGPRFPGADHSELAKDWAWRRYVGPWDSVTQPSSKASGVSEASMRGAIVIEPPRDCAPVGGGGGLGVGGASWGRRFDSRGRKDHRRSRELPPP